jgi:hypothetical protein
MIRSGQKGAFMKTRFLAGPFAAAALSLCTFSVWAGVLVPIPSVPGSTFMFVRSINDSNVFTGDYFTSDGTDHGFFGTIDGNYQTFDAPTGGTQGEGINNDSYITLYSKPSGNQIVGDSMLRKPDGKIVPITIGRATVDGYPEAILRNRSFVGERWVYDQNQQELVAYGYFGKGTKYVADINLPFDAFRTRPRGYNRHGEVVGHYRYANQGDLGFILEDGVATSVSYPDQNAYDVFLEGLNNSGQIVGGWDNADETAGEPFFYNSRTNSFDVIEVPGSTFAIALGINNAGVATIRSDVGLFLYCRKAKGCPGGANGIVIRERHISAGSKNSVLCQHKCTSSAHVPVVSKPADAAALRAAIARDPELQRELRLPFRV